VLVSAGYGEKKQQTSPLARKESQPSSRETMTRGHNGRTENTRRKKANPKNNPNRLTKTKKISPLATQGQHTPTTHYQTPKKNNLPPKTHFTSHPHPSSSHTQQKKDPLKTPKNHPNMNLNHPQSTYSQQIQKKNEPTHPKQTTLNNPAHPQPPSHHIFSSKKGTSPKPRKG